MSPYPRVATLLLVALLGSAAIARADSTLNIAGVRADLKSTDSKDELSALQALKGEDKIPDELIPDVLDLYVREVDAPPDTPDSAPPDMKKLAMQIEIHTLFSDLWNKMNSDKLAANLRPLLKDPKHQALVCEMLEQNEKMAAQFVPEICEILHTTKDSGMIGWCAKVLEKIKPPVKAAVPDLIAGLSETDGEAREKVSSALVAIGVDAPKYAPTLVKGLHDPDLRVSEDCGTLVSKLKFDPSTLVPQLLDALNGPFNSAAIDCLIQVGPKILQPTIDHAASAPPEGIFNHICVIRKFGTQATSLLAGDLHSTNDNLRYIALRMAIDFPTSPQNGVDWLTPYLTDSSKKVRILALGAWIHFQPDMAKRIELLTKDATDPDLRDTVIDIAGRLGPAANSLLPTIRERAALAGDEERIACLHSELEIDPTNDQAYQDLTAYLKNPDYIIFARAASTLINDPKLRVRSEPLLKKIHDDPKTDYADKIEIEMDWKYAPKGNADK